MGSGVEDNLLGRSLRAVAEVLPDRFLDYAFQCLRYQSGEQALATLTALQEADLLGRFADGLYADVPRSGDGLPQSYGTNSFWYLLLEVDSLAHRSRLPSFVLDAVWNAVPAENRGEAFARICRNNRNFLDPFRQAGLIS